jgi:hypothetical protein
MAKGRTLKDASQDRMAKRVAEIPRPGRARPKDGTDPFMILGTFLIGIAVGLLTGRFLKLRF